MGQVRKRAGGCCLAMHLLCVATFPHALPFPPPRQYYHRGKAQSANKSYKPPTRLEKMRFDQWLEKAYETESMGLNDTHYYLQLNSVGPDE